MTYFFEDAISRLEQVRDETLDEMKAHSASSDEWIALWQIEREIGSIIYRLKIAQARNPTPIPDPIPEPTPPKQYMCAHDYNLQAEYCPMGCKLV